MIRNYPGDGRPEHATSHEQPAASLTIMTDLSPLLEVAPNFRDIAAHAPLTRGLAYRSSELVGMSAQAQSVLRSLGVTTVYDLRTQAERTPSPDSLPEPIHLVIADVLADAPSSGAAALAALGSGGQQVDIAAVNNAIGGGKARDLMIDSYRDFIRLPSAANAYALFLRGGRDHAGVPRVPLHGWQGPHRLGCCPVADAGGGRQRHDHGGLPSQQRPGVHKVRPAR